MRSRGALGALFKRARTDCAKVGAIAIVIRLIVIVLVTVIIILRASSSGCVLRRSKSNSYSNSNRSSISISMSDSHNSSRASGFRQFRAGIVFLEFLAAENLKTKRRFPPLLRWRVGTRLVVISNSNSNSNSNNSISNSNNNNSILYKQ